MRGRRRVAALAAIAVAASLTACAPALPETVVPGSAVTVGWSGELTSMNAAAAPTPGNLDIAETIRADFGDLVDGEFIPDEGFGTVTIISDDPFTVRYDLAEPAWSDGIPLDAADLLLGWAAASGLLVAPEEGEDDEPKMDDAESDAEPTAEPDAETETGDAEVDAGPKLPKIDEFARSIDVTFPQPVWNWQRFVSVPVPAHVVAARALGVDDAMEAKQAVITAVRDEDASALASLAKVWHEGFALPEKGELPADLLISSGPFLVDEIGGDEGAQSVTLVPNSAYRGLVTPKVAKIELTPPADDAAFAVSDQLNVVQTAPTRGNRAPIRELERKDFTVAASHDGTMWALLLDPSGIFTERQTRTAFIHAIPANEMAQRGAGEWASAFTGTTSMVSSPGSRAYDIVNEDSGFAESLATARDEPALEREAAGVAPGTRVCVLFDRGSEFAAGAFAGLRDAAYEAGWTAVDCGSDDFTGALAAGKWDAVIARVPIPQTPEQIAAQWGSGGAASITGDADAERDALIVDYAQTADVYEARDILAKVEATIVRAAVALPIAVNPRVTIADRDVSGISPRTGATASLTYDVAQWEAVPD
ncbi:MULTISPECIES: ABC transporter substrate-binding protein [unclassified Microbacterium]|uniref:ABC transporter substrate-binding protein n=1 Tax=unclassified Microbacterium TaxID=2609290 RepID=UPI000EA92C65|nr:MULTISPECIES: ABC transporter substrate-binding protein [unclassified Microbacterium]MBT2484535.1 hypothetical protein [Microbacterium sp. ISL-108]RKN67436.1 hypothetical protein D7252_07480 [Microbacterium sp. CGR2]